MDGSIRICVDSGFGGRVYTMLPLWLAVTESDFPSLNQETQTRTFDITSTVIGQGTAQK